MTQLSAGNKSKRVLFSILYFDIKYFRNPESPTKVEQRKSSIQKSKRKGPQTAPKADLPLFIVFRNQNDDDEIGTVTGTQCA